MTEIPDGNGAEPRGWVGYDAHCRVCRSAARRWEGMFSRRGFPFVPLQDASMAARLGVEPGHIHEEMKLVLADGTILGGADAVLFLAGQIGWLAPLAWIGRLPPFHFVLARIYRWIALNRGCLGDACAVHAQDLHRRHPHTTVFFESP